MNLIAQFCCFILVFGTFQARAQSVARLEADSTQVETGNPIVLHFILSDTKIPDTLDFSPWQEYVSPSNIMSQTGWIRKGNTLNRDLTLIFFDADTINLAPLALAFNAADTLFTNGLELTIYATPSPDELTDMAPIKDINREIVVWKDYLPLAASILGGMAVLGLLFWWYSKAKKTKMFSRSISLPPHELALKKLSVLDQKALWRQGDVKGYCAELTFILREYLEKRYQVPALESTSQELLAHLKNTEFPLELKADFENVLLQTDLVKFAKAIPAEDFYPYAMDFARALVQNTIPLPEPTPDTNPPALP